MPRRVVLAGLCALLGGCLTPGPETRFHVLTPAVEAPTAASLAAPAGAWVVIRDIRLPAHLDRPQIVTRGAGNTLAWDETRQWGGPLGDELIRVLAMNLGRLRPGDRFVAAPHVGPRPPDYRIDVDVRSFERQAGGRVELAAQWRIARGADGSLAASGEETVVGAPVADRASYDELAAAMSAAWGELARAVAGGLSAAQAGR